MTDPTDAACHEVLTNNRGPFAGQSSCVLPAQTLAGCHKRKRDAPFATTRSQYIKKRTVLTTVFDPKIKIRQAVCTCMSIHIATGRSL